MGHELREDGAARQHPAFWRDRSPQAICPKNASAEEISSPHQIRENSCGLNRLYGFSCAMTGHQWVLVHGGWVDGSGWEGVYKALKKNGYAVTIVQEATTSLADDVATTKRAIASQTGPVILVGHSYGGAGITADGHDPQVVGLGDCAALPPRRGGALFAPIQE